MGKLTLTYYQQTDVTEIARDLLGKLLVTRWNDELTSGRIVETEAYNGVNDKASHAFSGRKTKRTEVMFRAGGCAYVYLCYGIHHLFNVVTNKEGTPHAVLIRAIEPFEGIGIMLERMSKLNFDNTVGKGPGNVSKALALHTRHSGYSLLGDELFIHDDGYRLKDPQIIASKRIGVDYAAEDAMLPYRFSVRGNPFVSGKKMPGGDEQ
jgi:DNA-3-methyladenine glycosylase